MADINITEVIQQTGLPASTLRYYEEVGLLHPTGRVGGRRQYDDSVLQRLAVIQTGQQAGFTLAELAILLNNVLDSEAVNPEWQGLIHRKLAEIDARLKNIRQMRDMLEAIMDCEDSTLAECIVLTGEKYRSVLSTTE